MLTDFQHISHTEAYGVINHLMTVLDRYYFCGSLTQGPNPIASLLLSESSYYSLHGALGFNTSPVYRFRHRKIVIYLKLKGRTLDKNHVLHTLTHEMVHAYVNTFCNLCDLDRDAVVGPNGDNHGSLWKKVFDNVLHDLQTWHPELADLPNATMSRTWLDRIERWYLGRMWARESIQRQWDGVEIVKKGGVTWSLTFPSKRILNRIGYRSHIDFVRDEVPNIRRIIGVTVATSSFILLTIFAIVVQRYLGVN
ncbi:hypothetical protein HD806DRAFT_518466 [Xylariaceae sp. AK1471]|nr:hypothetical protein HD806DRAFT_518466 [Xylariaceae sp. AK1471]